MPEQRSLKRCGRCNADKAREQFRLLPSGRRYRHCMECHRPHADAPHRAAYYKSAEYKQARRRRKAEEVGRVFRQGVPGRPALVCHLTSPEDLARRAWRSWLSMAPRSWLYAYRRAQRRAAIARNPSTYRTTWRKARHKKRLHRQCQADGTLAREGFAELYRGATRCAYCACKLTVREPDAWRGTDATLDHLVPVSAGGIHGLVNVAIVCADCNFTKRDTPFADWLRSLPWADAQRAHALWCSRYGAPPEQGLLL